MSPILTEPEVSFNATEIVVYESETHDVHGHFAILRKGPDLTSRTVVCDATLITSCVHLPPTFCSCSTVTIHFQVLLLLMDMTL